MKVKLFVVGISVAVFSLVLRVVSERRRFWGGRELMT